ncbi:nucleotidyltransferase domain-containing protein [Patescibacteria group bacterium]|nr:nucleotidyltransferase domain-containing protein [Patescibacteria group bacterium]MBU4070244.1 nucleotidyltransferase domain-containing protein [Nanoarchaeota archaeon]
MIELTKKEQEALLTIYKDIANFYNANSLSKELEITQVGTMKLLKRFEKNNILTSKKIGKSIVYKINIKEEFVQKLIAFALINEAGKYQRWKDEFKSLNQKDRILLFYGSASKDYSHAKDIDIFVILNKEDFKEVSKELGKIQGILPKKLHAIKATKKDLVKNIKENNKSMIEIIKTAIVLYGYDEYMGVVNEFAEF